MRLRIMTEPQQGASYADLLAVARRSEETGFDAFFRSDHYLAFSGDGGAGPSDAWTSLAGLARETSRVRLGTLVSPVTFREPAVLAVQVAQVDEMSGGRVELGIGAGWHEGEHAAFGLRFPPGHERFDRMQEQLEIITSLWSLPPGEQYTYESDRYTLRGNPGLPKPVQQRIPVIIGGAGRRRTPELTARFAAEFNMVFADLDEVSARVERVRAACAGIGRDPATLRISFFGTSAVGRTEAEALRRAAAFGGEVDELRGIGLFGGPAEVVDRLGALAERGVDTVYFQVLDLADLDHLDVIASEVMPQTA